MEQPEEALIQQRVEEFPRLRRLAAWMLTAASVSAQKGSTARAKEFVFGALALVECVNELWVVFVPTHG
jgi:hypothetical protein